MSMSSLQWLQWLNHGPQSSPVDEPPPVGQVATPQISPTSGAYPASSIISLSTATAGATIHYTLDGSTPSPTSGQVYNTPILLTGGITLKAIAFKTGLTDSLVQTAIFTIGTDIPTDVDETMRNLYTDAHYALIKLRFEQNFSIGPIFPRAQLIARKNEFMADPSYGHYAPAYGYAPEPTNLLKGSTRIMCAATYAWCAQDYNRADALAVAKMCKAQLLNQCREPLLSAAVDGNGNNSRWVPMLYMHPDTFFKRASNWSSSNPQYVNNSGKGAYGIDNFNQSLGLASAIVKWGRTYEFLRKCETVFSQPGDNYSWSSGERIEVKKYLLDWGYFFMKQNLWSIYQMAPRLVEYDDFLTLSGDAASSMKSEKQNGAIMWVYRTYKNGVLSPAREVQYKINRRAHNRSYLGMCAACESGARFKDNVLLAGAKKLHKNWLINGMFPSGDNHEIGDKGSATNPVHGWKYSCGMGPMMAGMARGFQRAGDNWMWDFTTSLGTEASAGGPKSIALHMEHAAKYVSQNFADGFRVHAKATSYSAGARIILENSTEDSRVSHHDLLLCVQNYKYKSASVKNAYNRSQAGTAPHNGYTVPGFPASSGSIEYGGTERIWNGFFGTEPDVVLFWANAEDIPGLL